MHNLTPPVTLRRSSRVPAAVPILVTSLEPETHFSEVCETLVVSAHGCAIRSPRKLKTGAPLHFHSKDGREATAQVVSCQPIGADSQGWKLGARLDQPENFWGLPTCPKDWAPSSALIAQKIARALPVTATHAPRPAAGPQLTPSADAPNHGARQLLEEQLRAMIADSVRPLQAEVTALREKLSRADANRSRFEVSLSSIPPELEQQLESRLKNHLGPRVLDEARQQSANLLAAVKTTIDQRTTEGYEDFLHRVADELQVVEQRAQDISSQISEKLRQHLQAGTAEFQQKLIDAGNRLKGLSEELLDYLQHNLNEEHNTRRAELERVRDAVAAESARLQEQVEYLDVRISKLDQSASHLESGLDKRLGEMASDAIRSTRAELESVTETICKEASNRNLEALAKQLDEACANMITFQKGTVASASDALRTERTEALRLFERSMEELAAQSVERWRQTLAGGLNSLIKSLADQFQLEGHPDPDRTAN
jgi:hypothetical protein